LLTKFYEAHTEDSQGPAVALRGRWHYVGKAKSLLMFVGQRFQDEN